MVRRRILLGDNVGELTFSINTININASAQTTSFYAKYNGVRISGLTNDMFTCDGVVISSVTIAGSAQQTIKANSKVNSGNSSADRDGYITMTYRGQSATINVHQSKDVVTGTTSTVSSGSPRDCSNYRLTNIIVGSENGVTVGYFCPRLTYDCYIDVTTKKYDVYASGRQVQTGTTTTVNTKTNYQTYYNNKTSYEVSGSYMCYDDHPAVPYTYSTNSITVEGTTYDFQVTVTNVSSDATEFTFTIYCTTDGYTNVHSTQYKRNCNEWQ